MPTQDTSGIKENILSYIKQRGPSLPVHIAKITGLSILFSSAFLSELLSERKVKISNMRVGSSPIYYIPGQENQLENFSRHLNTKEKEAFTLLQDKKILKDVNLSVNKGETLTIIGGSGSGKTVMLRLILGLIHADSGSLFYQDEDVLRMEEEDLINTRKQMGMLFQGGALFDSLTVGENIAYPLREHYKYSEEKIQGIIAEKLDLIGLPGIAELKPSDLSGGMQKRVSLARAIAADPKVILYDEPTTGLDPANTMRINNLIKMMQEKLHVTSVVVTHDMDSAFFISDRIAMLYNRGIEFVGSPEEAKTSDNRIVKNFISGNIGNDKELMK